MKKTRSDDKTLNIRRQDLLGVDQVEEFFAGLRVISELSQHGGGDGFTVDLLDTSHDHAHVTANRNNGEVK